MDNPQIGVDNSTGDNDIAVASVVSRVTSLRGGELGYEQQAQHEKLFKDYVSYSRHTENEDDDEVSVGSDLTVHDPLLSGNKTIFNGSQKNELNFRGKSKNVSRNKHWIEDSVYSPTPKGVEYEDYDDLHAPFISKRAESKDHIIAKYGWFYWNFLVACTCCLQLGASVQSLIYYSILLPAQILDLVGNEKKGTYLGLLMLGGGVIAILSPPLFGMISDRHSSRFGRRRPFIFGGILLNSGALISMGFAGENGSKGEPGSNASAWNVSLLIISFILVCFGYNLMLTAFSATVYENPIVPKAMFGTSSGIIGALSILGFGIGTALGTMVTPFGYLSTYIVLAVLTGVTGLITVCTYVEERSDGYEVLPEGRVVSYSFDSDNRSSSSISGGSNEVNDDDDMLIITDSVPQAETKMGSQHQSPALQSAAQGQRRVRKFERLSWKVFVKNLGDMWTPFKMHDFRWVFISRLFIQMGVYTVQEFLFYWVEDVIPMAGLSTATETSFLFIPVGLTAFISALVVGKLSDALGGKRKVFLFWSCLTMALLSVLLAVTQSYVIAMIIFACFGFAIGVFMSLDYAIVCDILPDDEHVARNLGVWHISIVLPQLFAAPLAGVILDSFQNLGKDTGVSNLGYIVLFIITAFYFIIAAVLFRKLKGVK